MKRRVCILSFSPIYRDARVLRQIEYLSPHYDLTVIGYGPPLQEWPDVQWLPVTVKSSLITRVMGFLLMVLGRVIPPLYTFWYWSKAHHREALENAVTSRADVYHANDWNALPVAAEAARRYGSKLVLDAHEYAPLEFEERRWWRWFYRPLVLYFLRRYRGQLNASMTVAPAIAERYAAELGFSPITVLNAPVLVPVEQHDIDPNNIRLVYHGGASPDRRLERMIETLEKTERRFTLHFIMVDETSPYVQSLKQLARRLEPERIQFHPPVPPSKIVDRIAEYDIGFYLLEPSNYNNSVALPNKFFDFLAAGLAVCVGPSPGMARMVKEYGFGCVTPSFDSGAASQTLNSLTAEEIARMREASRSTAQLFNADREMGKMLELYRHLFDDSDNQ
ncbi:MAG: glycosyltransferase family 4 protein [Chloroflexota bacterium]